MKKIIVLSSLLSCAAFAHALDIERWHTKNGTEVLLVQRHELPMVDFALVFKNAGSIAEDEGKSDTSNAAATLTLRGTKQIDEEQFMQQINELGSSVSGSSSLEYSVFGFRSLSDKQTLAQTVNLFAQALHTPRYDARVLQRIQDQAVQNLKQSESYPDYLTSRERAKLNYPNHPYGNSARRTEQSIRAVNVADVRRFHDDFYAQNNALVVIVGDVNRAQTERIVQQIVGKLPLKARKLITAPPVKVMGAQQKRVPFSGSQDTISLSLPLLSRDDPDYFTMLVGNYILGGGGFDSRLMKVLRDEKGYTYGAYSSLNAYEQKAPLTISFSTERANTEAALAATREVLRDFIQNGVSAAELKQAKDNITGSFPMRVDSNGKLVGELLGIGLYNRPSNWLDTYNDKINAVTAADIQAAWQRHLDPAQLNLVITGEEKAE
ncbi:M16 family metallopeptidase [Neisseriaceae bacterium B1]